MDVQKVLIIRFSSIGDIVLTTPVPRLLKSKGYEVHYLTKRSFKGMLEANPNIDQVHCIEQHVSEIIPVLKKENFDFVADLHKNIRSKQVVQSLNVASASIDKLNFKKLILVWFKLNLMPNTSIVERYIDVVKSLGIENDGKGLDYFIPESAHFDIQSYFPVESYVAFVIGGQHDGKMMSKEKIKSVCNKLSVPVILLGGKEDLERAEWIAAQTDSDVYSAAGKFSLDQSAYLLNQSLAVISHDTGLMHIASALKKPVISLWGGTVPELGFAPYMPGEHSVEIGAKHFMRPCSKLGKRRGIYRLFNFMDMISESSIVSAVNRILEIKKMPPVSR